MTSYFKQSYVGNDHFGIGKQLFEFLTCRIILGPNKSKEIQFANMKYCFEGQRTPIIYCMLTLKLLCGGIRSFVYQLQGRHLEFGIYLEIV